MTHYKAIIVLLTASCAFVVAAKAQSLPTHPYEGAIHTYTVNGLTPGCGYSFFMAAQADGTGLLDDGSTFEFDFLGETSGTVAPGESSVAVSVLWNNGAAQHLYYLGFTISNPEGCSVSRYLIVTPQPNAFDLLSENIPVDNTESCPATTDADGFNAHAGEYSAGNTTLQFKIRREGGSRDWSFEPTLGIDPSWNLEASIVSISAENSALVADNSGRYTVSAHYSEVLVTVMVKNYAGTEQVVTLGVRNQREENTQLTDSNPINDQVQHRITVMPVISDLEEL
jgi:hypothetical protein